MAKATESIIDGDPSERDSVPDHSVAEGNEEDDVRNELDQTAKEKGENKIERDDYIKLVEVETVKAFNEVMAASGVSYETFEDLIADVDEGRIELNADAKRLVTYARKALERVGVE